VIEFLEFSEGVPARCVVRERGRPNLHISRQTVFKDHREIRLERLSPGVCDSVDQSDFAKFSSAARGSRPTIVATARILNGIDAGVLQHHDTEVAGQIETIDDRQQPKGRIGEIRFPRLSRRRVISVFALPWL